MTTALLLNSAVPSNNAVNLYVLVYDFEFRDVISFQINPKFLKIVIFQGRTKNEPTAVDSKYFLCWFLLHVLMCAIII